MANLSSERKLQIHIIGENRLKTRLKEVLASLLPQLLPLIGKKIFLSGGDNAKILEAVSLAARAFVKEETLGVVDNCYLSNYYGKIALKFRLCITESGSSTYFERTVELGEAADGILNSVFELDTIVKDYALNAVLDEATERANITAYHAAQKTADLAKGKIKIPAEIYKYVD